MNFLLPHRLLVFWFFFFKVYYQELRRKDQVKGSDVYALISISGEANISVISCGFSGTLIKVPIFQRRAEGKMRGKPSIS